MKQQHRILLLVAVIAIFSIIAAMPKKSKDFVDEPEKAEQDKSSGISVPVTMIPEADAFVLALVRPIRREFGRYAGTRPAETQVATVGPFRGNAAESMRSAVGAEIAGEHLCLFGDGMLCPYFRESLNRIGMMKGEHDAERRYLMVGKHEAVTQGMQAAGFHDFVLNAEGVRALVDYLVRQLLERQDALVETGPRFSPVKSTYDQASRLPGILDFHRWRVNVLPNLGPHGHVRITGYNTHS